MNVEEWARSSAAADPAVNRAFELLAKLPPAVRRGRVLVPFPVGSDEAYRGIDHATMNRLIGLAPIGRVALKDLSSNGQKSISPTRVRDFIEAPSQPGTKHGGAMTDLPIVVRRGGRATLFDGHHRATASYLRGETHVAARVVDLDA